MTGIPFVPVLAVTVFGCLVTLLRCVFLRDSVADRLINRALGLASVGMLLLVLVGSENPVDISYLRAISGFCTASSVFGAARLLGGADPRGARDRQLRYDLVAMAGVALTGAIDLTYLLGFVPQAIPTAWYTLAGALSSLPLAASGFLLMRAGIREIRSEQTPLPRRVLFAVLVAVACFWICYSVLLLVLYLTGVPPTDPGRDWAMTGFFFFAVLTALLAVPLVHLALVRTGLDRDSRDCRTLRPLWSDLTAAVPHVALTPEDTDDRGPASRRYRMAIEIRDALLQLRRQAADQLPDDIRGHTLRVVRAAEAGVVTGAGHDSELRALLDLAARWPRAKRDYLAATRLPALSAAPASR